MKYSRSLLLLASTSLAFATGSSGATPGQAVAVAEPGTGANAGTNPGSGSGSAASLAGISSDSKAAAAAAVVGAGSPGSGAAGASLAKASVIAVPDTKEASDYREKEKAVKTAPKDRTYADDLIEGGDTFRKSSPKMESQKMDVPDTESLLQDLDEMAVTSPKNDKPVVLNDYDPANLGSTSKNDKDVKAGDKKTADAKGEKEKEDRKEATSEDTVAEKMPPKKEISGSTGTAPKGDMPIESSTDSVPTSSTPSTKADLSPSPAGEGENGGVLHSFFLAFSMIIVSEIGDKTFLIAALMAMKHPRITVFTAAAGSLVIMTVLSALIGNTLPALLPRKLTSAGAAVLFLIFGYRLMKEGLGMSSEIGVEEEMQEVEEEIETKEMTSKMDLSERGLQRSDSDPHFTVDGLESAEAPLYTNRSRNSAFAPYSWKSFSEGFSNLAGLVISPVWVQVFVMTFLGEWGDRSQIATIAMAAGSDYWSVIVGAIFGHTLCTAAAVIGGKLLASKISMRTVTLGGAFAFLVFAVFYLIDSIRLKW